MESEADVPAWVHVSDAATLDERVNRCPVLANGLGAQTPRFWQFEKYFSAANVSRFRPEIGNIVGFSVDDAVSRSRLKLLVVEPSIPPALL